MSRVPRIVPAGVGSLFSAEGNTVQEYFLSLTVAWSGSYLDPPGCARHRHERGPLRQNNIWTK